LATESGTSARSAGCSPSKRDASEFALESRSLALLTPEIASQEDSTNTAAHDDHPTHRLRGAREVVAVAGEGFLEPDAERRGLRLDQAQFGDELARARHERAGVVLGPQRCEHVLAALDQRSRFALLGLARATFEAERREREP
jgi:hypothetical protein